MSKVYGWAGKILRVNLTTGDITTEDTAKHFKMIGGMGIGYKVIFDEVPVGTKPYDEANKIIFAVGPFTGASVPCGGRTNITSLTPVMKGNHVADSHMGGDFGPKLKYAGYDALIIEGKAAKPTWLNIQDDKVTLESAEELWGKGIYDATAMISDLTNTSTCVAAIGPAGENLVNMSVIINSFNHSAGVGHGAVLGSKNLKAIAVNGTGSVYIKDPKTVKELNDYMLLEVIGSNNNHVVPRTEQSWAEFHSPSSRWTSGKGKSWELAEGGPVETGENPPGNINQVGYRCLKSIADLGDEATKYTVKMTGCHGCPIRCYSALKVDGLENHGMSPYAGNTCVANMYRNKFMVKGVKDEVQEGDAVFVSNMIGQRMADNLGVWCNYAQLERDFTWLYNNNKFEEFIPAEEYKEIPWHYLDEQNPDFIIEVYERIAHKTGEFGRVMGLGSYEMAKELGLGNEYWGEDSNNLWSDWGFPKHHSNETAAQVGALINCMFNRDCMCHSHVNITGSGLPIDLQREILGEVFGSETALDYPKNYTPMNEYKAKFAKWSIVTNCLHDSITLCNWVWPMMFSPTKAREYRGDLDLEAKYYSAITGESVDREGIYEAGERIMTMHRALQVKQMGTVNLREEHDSHINDWVFTDKDGLKPFTEGTIVMDREDMQLGLTMLYKEFGWDEKTGAPTRATLEKLDLKEVADDLESLGLLP